MEEARAKGAIAFFGDKYGEVVRILAPGPSSIELCGGTHVSRLGDIGPVKIVTETSIGSNLHPIEPVAGTRPVHHLPPRTAARSPVAAAAAGPAGTSRGE